MAYIGSRPDNVVSRQSSKTYRYTATAGQTVFSGADQDNQILAITPSDAEVHMNGLMLDPTDYTLTGTSVTLSTAATAGDELTVTGRQTFEVADTYTKTAADSRYVNTTGDTMTGQLVATGPYGIRHNGFGAISQYFDTANYDAIRFLNNAGTQEFARVGYDIVSGSGLARIEAIGANSQATIVTNNAGRLIVDSAGRVTKPYQPMFDVKDAGYSGGIAIWTTVSANVGNHYNTSNGRFTAPIAGYYIFTLTVGSNASYGVDIRKNGSTYRRVEHVNPPGFSWNTTCVVMYLGVNDFIDCWAFTGTPSNNYPYGGFSGYLLG